MNRNSNFYKAIEEAIIKPQSEEMHNAEPADHDFSEEYADKIAEIFEEEKEKAVVKKKKISFKYFMIIAAAALLAGTVTVTANESVRKTVFRMLNIGGYSEESTEEIVKIPVTEPVYIAAVTSVPVKEVTSVSTTQPPQTTAVRTTVTTTTTVVSQTQPVTGDMTMPPVVENAVVTRHKYNNVNQRPSMMAPSVPDTTAVTTAVTGSSADAVTTTVKRQDIIIGTGSAIVTTGNVGEEDIPFTTIPLPENPIITTVLPVTSTIPATDFPVTESPTKPTEPVETTVPPTESPTEPPADTPTESSEETLAAVIRDSAWKICMKEKRFL